MTEQIGTQPQDVLAQVWIQLGSEDQTGVICLMAQLVIKLIEAQIENSRKEASDDQNPG